MLLPTCCCKSLSHTHVHMQLPEGILPLLTCMLCLAGQAFSHSGELMAYSLGR